MAGGGVPKAPNADPLLRRVELTDAEVGDVVAFLETLSRGDPGGRRPVGAPVKPAAAENKSAEVGGKSAEVGGKPAGSRRKVGGSRREVAGTIGAYVGGARDARSTT